MMSLYVLLQVAAGFGGGFSVIVLWGHDTMMLLVSAIYVSCFFILCGLLAMAP